MRPCTCSRLALALCGWLAACTPKGDAPSTTSPEPAAAPARASVETPARDDATAETEDDAAARAREAPPPAGLAAGVISDFENGKLTSEFGAGWQPGSDAMSGGASTVELDVENGALRMRGTIDTDASAEPWAGAMFFPGDQPMRPANLDGKPTLVFQARGDGPLTVLVFAERLGTTPAVLRVEIGEEWAEHTVDLHAMLAGEAYDVTAIVLGGPPRPGEFETHVDDVRLR